MSEFQTTVQLKVEPNLSSVKSTIISINKMIQSSLKTSVDLTFNIKGEKQVKALKERLKREIKVPIEIKEATSQIAAMRKKIGQTVNVKVGVKTDKIDKVRERLAKEIKVPITPVKSGGGGLEGAIPKATPAPVKPQITGVQGFLGQMNGLAQQVGSLISGAVLVGFAKGVTKGIIEVGSRFESLKTMISNALGGVEEGEAAMEMIKQIARETYQSIEDVGGSFNKLINRGLKPTKQEIIQLTDFAKSQGKELDQLAEAVLDAMTGENERLKEFGVKAKDAGDKVILTFKGISTAVNKNEQDIYNYLVALGKVPGVAGMSAKAAETFDGKMKSIKGSIDSIKIEIFNQMKGALEPLLKILENIVGKIQKWVEVHPKLATAIAAITVGIIGLIGVILILIPILSTLSVVINSITWPLLLVVAAIILVVIQIGILIWVFQDLWNGLTQGESYIFAIIDGFLEWLGIGISVQDMIDGITAAFNVVADVVMNYVVPVIMAEWDFLVQTIGALVEGLVDTIAIVIDIIVALFTGDIPKAARGFEMLKQNAIAVFEQMVAAAASAASRIISVFADAVAKVKSMVSELPLIGGLAGGALGKFESGLRSTSRSLAATATNNKNSAARRKEQVHSYTGQGNTGRKRMGAPGSKKKGGGSTNPYGKMPGGAGGGSGGGSGAKKGKKGGKGGGGGKKGKNKGRGGGGGGKKDSSGKNRNQETIQEQKAVVTAIEGLQEILKKTGYSITSEIKRANLFEAKRQALLASQRQTGVKELWSNIKEIFFKKEETKQSTQKIELFLSDGSKASSFGITKNTSLGDFFKIINSRNGG